MKSRGERQRTRAADWLRGLLAAALLGAAAPAAAVTVDPDGVNVRHSGASTAFLTFRGIRPDQSAAEGTWCGEIAAGGSCVPGTIFGRLPGRLDLSRRSGASNLTDIMTIPRSVTRRAFQDARRGNPSQFFYVRRFVSTAGAPDEFVPVTCRMASGGARTPLALLEVDLRFDAERPVLSVERGETPPPFAADIRYNGTGRLKGRWEVVLPGDPPPERRDLLTEASLPVEERPLQRRYTLLDRFDVFLPPTGSFRLPGPDPSRLPSAADGYHLILLRVEATDDKEGNSDIGGGVIVVAGGVAGFPLPVLRYYVGAEGDARRGASTPAGRVRLQRPGPGARVAPATPFSWSPTEGAVSYEIEIHDDAGRVLAALVRPPRSSYFPPPWLEERAGDPLRWRVRAHARGGRLLAESEWREMAISPKGEEE